MTVILRGQSKQISNPGLVDQEREICAITQKAKVLRGSKFGKGMSQRIYISRNPTKETNIEI